jgi:allantoicase
MLEQAYLKETVPDNRNFQVQLHLEKTSPWKAILPFEVLKRDTYHRFSNFENNGPFTHILYMHYPNGGIHGLKMMGK